jgi:copper chaperone
MLQYQEFEVANLKCGGCAESVRSKLLEMPEIRSVEVDVEKGQVRVSGAGLKPESIVSELHALGYPLLTESNSVITKAKSYISCAIGRMK